MPSRSQNLLAHRIANRWGDIAEKIQTIAKNAKINIENLHWNRKRI
jgi:hypothetical protein